MRDDEDEIGSCLACGFEARIGTPQILHALCESLCVFDESLVGRGELTCGLIRDGLKIAQPLRAQIAQHTVRKKSYHVPGGRQIRSRQDHGRKRRFDDSGSGMYAERVIKPLDEIADRPGKIISFLGRKRRAKQRGSAKEKIIEKRGGKRPELIRAFVGEEGEERDRLFVKGISDLQAQQIVIFRIRRVQQKSKRVLVHKRGIVFARGKRQTRDFGKPLCESGTLLGFFNAIDEKTSDIDGLSGRSASRHIRSWRVRARARTA